MRRDGVGQGAIRDRIATLRAALSWGVSQAADGPYADRSSNTLDDAEVEVSPAGPRSALHVDADAAGSGEGRCLTRGGGSVGERHDPPVVG